MFIVFTVPRSVASHVLAVLGVVAVLVVVLSVAMAYGQARRQVEATAVQKVTSIATTIAATDDVREGIEADDPAAALAGFAEHELALTGADFIVIMSPDGVRYTHPDPDQVGEIYLGTVADAQAGGTVVEDYVGTLGPSTRAVVPVMVSGQVRALVAVGVLREKVTAQMRPLMPQIVVAGLTAGVLSGAAAFVVASRVRRQTMGLNADDLKRLHDHHEAVLHAVREGLIIVGADGRVEVINDEARRLLGFEDDVAGRRLVELGLPADLERMLTASGEQADIPQVQGGRVLLVSSREVSRSGRGAGPARSKAEPDDAWPAAVKTSDHLVYLAPRTALVRLLRQGSGGKSDGDRHDQQPNGKGMRAQGSSTLTTLRDRTELEALTGQLGAARSLANALHAQAHEAANRMHTVTTLIELGRTEEALSFATDELRATQRQRDAVLAAIEEPSVAALLLGKNAQAAERGVSLEIDDDAYLPEGVIGVRAAVTILGNLIDNAIDAAAGSSEKLVTVDAEVADGRVMLTVSDSGPGLDADALAHGFERGWSTKQSGAPAGRGIGLALVRQTVDQLGGSVQVSEGPGAVFSVRVPVKPGAGHPDSRGTDEEKG